MDDRFAVPGGQDPATGSQQRIDAVGGRFLEARAVREDRTDVRMRVRNLSAGGLMAETDEPFAVAELLTVELGTIGSIAARVAWVRPGQVGLAFARRIDPRLVHPLIPPSTMEPVDGS